MRKRTTHRPAAPAWSIVPIAIFLAVAGLGPARAQDQRAPQRGQISDFERDLTSRWGGGWDAFASGPRGGGQATIARVRPGFESEAALSLRGIVPITETFTFVGAAVQLGDPQSKFDVSAYAGVRFAVRGDGSWLQVMLIVDGVEDLNYPTVSIQAGERWEQITLLFSDFERSPLFGTREQWDGTGLVGLAWATELGFFGEVNFEIDDLTFFAVDKSR